MTTVSDIARRCSILVLAGSLLLAGVAFGQSQRMAVSRNKVTPDPEQENRLPRALREIGWDQNIGADIPLDLAFTDQDGQVRPLADYFGDSPVLLAPVYFDCPMLCSLVLDGVVRGLKPLQFTPGEEFEVVAVSFDPGEDSELARQSYNTAIARYGRSDAGDRGWHFLTGDQESISTLMDAIGFRYQYQEETDLWAHAGGVVLLTPNGKISRYFYGVDYAPKDLRLGLVEASQNKVGNVVDQVLLFCFQYDPSIGKYSAATMNLVRAGGVLTVLLLILYIVRMVRSERREPATT